jgi:SAM-dependent methyltransferase
MLPFSEACERNIGPILEVLTAELTSAARLLEIGSGTGQHAVHFARHLPHLLWQPSDRAQCLPGLIARIEVEGPANLRAPRELDVAIAEAWPAPGTCDAVFSANTLHIMSWPVVEAFFRGVGRLLGPIESAVVLVYGPFRYAGNFTTDSNAAFDRMLRERDPRSGIRDIEAVDALAARQGFMLQEDHAMPANNQMIVWRHRGVP